jgi:Zinc dependent phospholipase C
MLPMPTPFMHLAAAQRFLNDAAILPSIREELRQADYLGAFLLGNVAPDARVSSGLRRGDTHFFEYSVKVEPPAGVAMLTAHPHLRSAEGTQRAFVAGYLAHLAMDVVWTEAMLFPHFYLREWGNQNIRYEMLHVLLCHLDGRDYKRWDADFGDALAHAKPSAWLSFLSDSDLETWRDLIAEQICKDCESDTLSVLGSRVMIGRAGLQAILENPERLQAELWDNISLEIVAQVEESMYAAMVKQLVDYMTG